MLELQISDVNKPSNMFIDNQAAINMLNNTSEGKVTKGKKHIEIKRKMIKSHINKTVIPIYIEYCLMNK